MTATQTTVSHESDLGRWTLVQRNPAPILRPYALRYAGYLEQARRFSQHLQTPFTGIPLIINFGSPYRISSPGRREQQVTSFAAGLYDGPALVGSDDPQHSLQINLTPLGARRIFGLPMHELTNQVVEIDDLIGRQAPLFVEQLHDASDWEERFAIVDGILRAWLDRAPEVPPGVAFAWERLERSGGTASIAGLAGEMGWSHKHLISRFREHIGLPPKKLARILRFERAIGAIQNGESVCLASVAQAAGYFDQAHLHRDFREFAGRTPGELLNRRLPGIEGLIGD